MYTFHIIPLVMAALISRGATHSSLSYDSAQEHGRSFCK